MLASKAPVVLAAAALFKSAESAHFLGQSTFSPIDLRVGRSKMSENLEIQAEMDARDAEVSKQWAMMKDEQAPWTAKEQQVDEAGRNICIRDKQVPDFYVLGVQKCATSSLANNLMDAGMSNVHGDLNPKEFHWFDHRMDYSLLEEEGYETNKKEWLSWMPDCPKEDAAPALRNALADFTPDYFRIVPRPHQDFLAAPRDWMKVQELDIIGPKKMINIYGEEKAKKLQFAVMFREPLAQMQSAWYHAKSFNFHNACKSCKAESFAAALSTNLEGLQQEKPELSPWVWTTMYARQMEPWLQYFNASQFYVIPMHQLTSDKKDTICSDLSQRLDFSVNCDSAGVESLHSWSHEHPGVDEDAGEMRAAFDKFIAPENTHLVRLLAEASTKGMGLANYDGAPGDEAAVREWLESSW